MCVEFGTRAQFERYFRRHGLPDLVHSEGRPPWGLGVVGLWLAAAVVLGVTDWRVFASEAQLTWPVFVIDALLVGTVVGLAVSIGNRCARQARYVRGRLGAEVCRDVPFLIGAMFLAYAVYVIRNGGPGHYRDSELINAYDLAWVLVPLVLYVLGVVGGVTVTSAVLQRVTEGMATRTWRVASAMPEMLAIVVFVVIIPDAWRLLATMVSWRVEVLLIGCIAVLSTGVCLRLLPEIRACVAAGIGDADAWWADDPDAYESMRSVARGLQASGDLPQPSLRVRINIVMSVVVPVVASLVLATLLLSAVLFAVGVTAFDSGHLREVAPGTHPAAGAAKVAVLLSSFVTVVVALGEKQDVLRQLAAPQLEAARRAVGWWHVYHLAIVQPQAADAARGEVTDVLSPAPA